jgi:tetratricopeptide (TPR) repeat protein
MSSREAGENMMVDDILCLTGGRRIVVLIVMTVVASAALLLSAGNFAAERIAVAAVHVLDDPQTEHLDVVGLSADTLKAYDDAISDYRRAAALAPLNAGYTKNTGDIYFRMALWREAMLQMRAALPDALARNESLGNLAFEHVRRSVGLDPSNAGLRICLGQMLASAGEHDKAQEQFAAAVALYPINAETRYLVAMQYLAAGKIVAAREQAVILAGSDDSYRLDDDDPRVVVARAQRMPWYTDRLSSSYLYKALEIIWRAGGTDRNVIAAAVPNNTDARETVRIFLDQKGIAEMPHAVENR